MQVRAVKTKHVKHGDSLEEILDEYIPILKENSIIAITSKIISIVQGRAIAKENIDKEELISREADAVFENDNVHGICLTIKNNILIPSAGIDESNGEGVYILYPENIQATAIFIWSYLREKHSVTNLGVIITDSHTTPMRMGVTGIALGWCGFEPLYSYIGKPDLYGKPLQFTNINLLDALATAAVLIMGEGDEQTPISVINEAPKITFLQRAPSYEEEKSIIIPLRDDIYFPLLKNVKLKATK